jgi:hypothetical protein
MRFVRNFTRYLDLKSLHLITGVHFPVELKEGPVEPWPHRHPVKPDFQAEQHLRHRSARWETVTNRLQFPR